MGGCAVSDFAFLIHQDDFGSRTKIRRNFLDVVITNVHPFHRLRNVIQKDFSDFCRALDGCLEKIPGKHKPKLATLMN